MKVGIAGPISSENIAQFLDGDIKDLPRGYLGAPFLSTLIGVLLKRGHNITAYTTSSDLQLSERFIATGERFKISFCPVRPRAFRYDNGHLGRAADAFRLERAALRQAMLDDAPDLVHAHWTYEFAMAAIESGLPHLITCHDAPQVVLRHAPNLYWLVRYFMARRVLNQAQYLTAVSPYLKQKLEGYARAPISVVPNPLPVHPAHLAASARQYDPIRPRIAMVLNGWGALKNPQPALHAFAVLRRTFPAAELSIMGSDYGPGGKAEAWAQSHGLAQGVHFMGPQPYPILLSKLAESDLLLHPSLEESFGMSVVEAMSLGVPVVGGQASGAVPWVIDGDGRLVDVRSAEAIAQAALDLLVDAQAFTDLGAQTKSNTVGRFSPDAVAAAYESHYREVMAGEDGQ